jgi:F0F1-type ATP synthase membrane subunit b/b'
VRFRRNKRQQPGKETDKNYKKAQQDAERRKEHADKGLDRRFAEETMKKTSSAKPEIRDSLSKYL